MEVKGLWWTLPVPEREKAIMPSQNSIDAAVKGACYE
jgi:hypothetical protein